MLRKGTRLTLVLALGVPIAVAAAAGAAFVALLYGDLPGTVPLPHDKIVSTPSHVYDIHGNEIAIFREFDLSVEVEPTDIPQVLKDAVISAEDRNFWEHEGIDPVGIARAAWTNWQGGEVAQGGSTITQQYVKATYLSGERSIERKLNEAILATRLEREMSKEEILFRYLDSTYFGGGAYGVGAAAETYFRKPVSELNISEAALLASVIPAPSKYAPRENPFLAEERRTRTLADMKTEGYITTVEYEQALTETLWLSTLGPPDRPATVYYPPPEAGAGSYPYFVDYVRTYLVDRYGPELVYRGGLKIETTIDPDLQALAEETVAKELEGTAPPLEMSLVSLEPKTGHVKAMVGGRDWNLSQVNLALGGVLGMQPGSSFKPFVLAAAFEKGFGPQTVYPAPGSWTVPGCGGSQCTVSNYDGGGYGALTLEAATRASVNTVFAQLVYDVGPQVAAEFAHRVGVTRIDPDAPHGVSLALGAAEVSPLDMAAGFAVFANSGIKADATPIVRITDPEGEIIEDNSGLRGERVVNAAVADWVTQVLKGVITGGTGKRANIGRPAAGKTGTAQEYRAAWFVGYTPDLSTAVWMGHSDRPQSLYNIKGTSRVAGGTIPARTWATFMKAALEGKPALDFPPPGILPAPNGAVPIKPTPQRSPVSTPIECFTAAADSSEPPACPDETTTTSIDPNNPTDTDSEGGDDPAPDPATSAPPGASTSVPP